MKNLLYISFYFYLLLSANTATGQNGRPSYSGSPNGTHYIPGWLDVNKKAYFHDTLQAKVFGTFTNERLDIYANGTKAVSVFTSGNIVIGSSTTDDGNRIQSTGVARLGGLTMTSGSSFSFGNSSLASGTWNFQFTGKTPVSISSAAPHQALVVGGNVTSNTNIISNTSLQSPTIYAYSQVVAGTDVWTNPTYTGTVVRPGQSTGNCTNCLGTDLYIQGGRPTGASTVGGRINFQTATTTRVDSLQGLQAVETVWSIERDGSLKSYKTLATPAGSYGFLVKDDADGTIDRVNIVFGTATLASGTVTVSNANITANSVIVATHKTISGTAGILSYSLSAGVSFTITSANAGDNSTVSYYIKY